MLELIRKPWPWWVAGPLIGLIVPLLLLLGNKPFGISSNLRHICAACLPGRISYFQYDWKKYIWNLFFIAGIILGAFIAVHFLSDQEPIRIAASTRRDLSVLGVRDFHHLLPKDLFSWRDLFTPRGFIFMVVGGFLVGFGTRYAGGCTSGHSIMGMASLQWSSLVATCCFMVGGFFTTYILFPLIFKLP
ncbi:MAG: YeeE/YedE family protein [Chitinophagaceae bacterium]